MESVPRASGEKLTKGTEAVSGGDTLHIAGGLGLSIAVRAAGWSDLQYQTTNLRIYSRESI